MAVHVVIATKGRPAETGRLMTLLAAQTLAPARVVVVGVSDEDLPDPSAWAAGFAARTHLRLADRAGLTIQRNVGLDMLKALGADPARDVAVFFDDDFRPAIDWLQGCEAAFARAPDLIGLGGGLLADGALGTPVSEAEADALIAGEIAPRLTPRDEADAHDLYGCNMAFRLSLFDEYRFDEALPLYGWLEDRDMTANARRLGRLAYLPSLRGVHLGVQRGRTSGRRLGYSQIANPVHLWGKGAVSLGGCIRLCLHALVANLVRSFRNHPTIDYRGRLAGNLKAMQDGLAGRLDPRRILDWS